MKKPLIVLSPLVFALPLFFFGDAPPSRPDFPKLILPKTALGAKDDPQARLRFDWRRFQDPVSQKIPDNIRQQELKFARTLPVKGRLDAPELQKNGVTKNQGVLTWRQRGPYNIGGRTRALAIDAGDENVILAGGVSGGMWRTEDGGDSWRRTTDFADIPGITCVVQDKRPGKTHIWYYGTGEFLGSTQYDLGGSASLTGDGVYKSIDGGQSWQPLPSTISGTPQYTDQPFDYVWNLAADASNAEEDEIYAATFGTIQRSIDGGESWETALGAFDVRRGSVFSDIQITSGGVAYAVLGSVTRDFQTPADSVGIYRSENGVDWTMITPDAWPVRYFRTVIGIAPSNENVVYFLAHAPGTGDLSHILWKYTYLSGDGSAGGGKWDDLTANIPAFGGEVGDFNSQGSYDLTIAIKPDDETVVFAGGVNLYRSSSGFSNNVSTRWIGGYVSANNLNQYTNHHPDQQNLAFSPSDPDVLFSSHDGGVSVTRNNLEARPLWRDLSNGYITTQFFAAAIDQTPGSNFIIGGMQDNGTWGVNTMNETAEWREFLGGDGGFCAIIDSGFTLYTSTQEGKVYRRELDQPGGRVTGWARVDPQGGNGYAFISPFILDPNDDEIMYHVAGSIIWRNTGLSEIPSFSNEPTAVNWQLLTASRASASISALAASMQPANILYFGTGKGKIYKMLNANEGQPERIDLTVLTLFPRNAYINSIAIDPENSDRVLIAFSNYRVKSIFYTEDGGANWTHVSGNLEEEPSGNGAGASVRSVAILPGVKKLFFAGTSTGLYSTTSLNGESTFWAREGAATIANAVVDMVVTRAADGEVAVATHGNGVFSTNLITGIEAPKSEIPRRFSLLQNYPNPFNPETTIPFDAPVASHVKIVIYDMLGRPVRTLADGVIQAGRNKRVWDGRNNAGRLVTSGAYIVRLTSEGRTDSKKILLLR